MAVDSKYLIGRKKVIFLQKVFEYFFFTILGVKFRFKDEIGTIQYQIIAMYKNTDVDWNLWRISSQWFQTELSLNIRKNKFK